MKRQFLIISLFLFHLSFAFAQQSAGDSLWIRYDDRFKANGIIKMLQADTFQVLNGSIKVNGANYLVPVEKADVMFQNPGRYLLKPNTYSGTNYTNVGL